ncbi:Uncharacterised protein [Bordetella pertussis]|nr:Uncharacterised protein [Bordetella pertussis]CPQ80756.1 Uncharacterised protein [Bordetella pertussis]
MAPARSQPLSRRWPASAAAAAPVAGSSYTPPAANALRACSSVADSAWTQAIVTTPVRFMKARPAARS